ncbi:XdhC family protein [Luteibacter sp. 621]|uniref:XdhC family protein n=1 Tax=Luteibacter sp. 621 TaxID=3373916 RepID=UPI003D25E5BE
MPDWPWYGMEDDLLPAIDRWQAAGLDIALATLVKIEGTSPRPVGSEMAIASNGECAGYVSGGCVEAAVVHAALDSMESGVPVLLDYGAGSPVIDLQLTCGGRIHVLVRPLHLPDAFLAELRRARTTRRTVTVMTDRATGAWSVRDGAHRAPGGWFAKVVAPPLRLVVVGSDPVALAVLMQAVAVGMEAVLVRPNGPAVPPPGISLAAYHGGQLAPALAACRIDRRTAVYTFTHDDDQDDVALSRAIEHGAFAAGALGSRHKTGLRRTRLAAAGYSRAAIDALHLPAGVKAPAVQGPRQIAATIISEILCAAPSE